MDGEEEEEEEEYGWNEEGSRDGPELTLWGEGGEKGGEGEVGRVCVCGWVTSEGIFTTDDGPRGREELELELMDEVEWREECRGVDEVGVEEEEEEEDEPDEDDEYAFEIALLCCFWSEPLSISSLSPFSFSFFSSIVPLLVLFCFFSSSGPFLSALRRLGGGRGEEECVREEEEEEEEDDDDDDEGEWRGLFSLSLSFWSFNDFSLSFSLSLSLSFAKVLRNDVSVMFW